MIYFFTQNSNISFTNNTAGEAGAAIYASDMSRCLWYGPVYPNTEKQPIFVPVDGYNSPFTFMSVHDAYVDTVNIFYRLVNLKGSTSPTSCIFTFLETILLPTMT